MTLPIEFNPLFDSLLVKLDSRLTWSQIQGENLVSLSDQEAIDLITLIRMYQVQTQVDDALGSFLRVVLSD